jgi:hypothetical protein
VIKFCYRKRPTGHSRNGKDDSSQDPKIQAPSSPLSRQSLSTPSITTYHAGEQCWSPAYSFCAILHSCLCQVVNIMVFTFGVVRRVLRDRPRDATPKNTNSSQVHPRGKGEDLVFSLSFTGVFLETEVFDLVCV